jgi:transposase
VAAEKVEFFATRSNGKHQRGMRGHDQQQDSMFSYISLEKRVPSDHPLRRVRAMTDRALGELSPKFSEMYSRYGRPSIAPEKLLRALLLQMLFSVRSERLLMEELNYNLLYRWFVGWSMDEEVWDVTVFTKNRERLLEGEIAQGFFEAVLQQAEEQKLLSDEHFTVDGTLIKAWASRQSFQEKKDPPERGTGSGGRKTLRDTHESRSDPEARLYKKSTAGEARPSYLGHLVMENRNGLIVKSCVTQSGTREEPQAALAMLKAVVRKSKAKRAEGQRQEWTLGGDKGYQKKELIEGLRELGVIPHIAEYSKPLPQWPNCLTSSEREHPGFAISQGKRKWIEKHFGWIKSVAGFWQTKLRGRRRVDWAFCLVAAASNLIRLVKLLPSPA